MGVSVKNGTVKFQPDLLKKEEFRKGSKTFRYTDVNFQENELMLEKNTLCFTYCQIPVVYTLAEKNSIQVLYLDEKSIEIDELILNSKISNQIFARTGAISMILVNLNERNFKYKTETAYIQ